jgi:hypothetical protein
MLAPFFAGYSRKMIVTSGLQRLPFEEHFSRSTAQDCPDARCAAGAFDILGECEQKLVVLAAVERPFIGCASRHRNTLDVCSDARGFRETMQIQCEAVADIHAGSGTAAELAAER